MHNAMISSSSSLIRAQKILAPLCLVLSSLFPAVVRGSFATSYNLNNGGGVVAHSSSSISQTPQRKDRRDHHHGHTYQHGQRVELWASKVTSAQALFSIDYESFPFCQPDNLNTQPLGPGLQPPQTNALGQGLSKNHRIYTTPYMVLMGKDMYCEQVCVAHVGRNDQRQQQGTSGASSFRVDRAIRNKYQLNWLLDDNLPAAYVKEDPEHILTTYHGSIPMGFVSPKDDITYLYNHMNIIIHYQSVGRNQFRILRFQVQPFSIHHQFQQSADASQSYNTANVLPQIVNMINPIQSCGSSQKERNGRVHTNYDSLAEVPPQPAHGKVLFTYDVNWIENQDLEWTDRWEIYMTMDGALPIQPRIMYLFNALISTAIVASVAVAFIQFVSSTTKRKHRTRTDGRNDAVYTQLASLPSGTLTTQRTTNVQHEPVDHQIDDSPTHRRMCSNNSNNQSNNGDDISVGFGSGEDDYSEQDDCSSEAEDGWRDDLEHYVFSPPTRQPHLLASCVAVGFHLAMTAFVLLLATPVAGHIVNGVGGGGNGGVFASLIVVFVVSYSAIAPFAGAIAGRMALLLTGGREDSASERSDNSIDSKDDGDDQAFLVNEGGEARDEDADNEMRGIFTPSLATNGGMMTEIIHTLSHLDMGLAFRVLRLPAMFPLCGLVVLFLMNALTASIPEEPGVYLVVQWLSISILCLIYAFIFMPLLGLGYVLGISTRRRTALDDLMQQSRQQSTSLDNDVDLGSVEAEAQRPLYATPFFQACSGCLSFLICYQEFAYLLDAMFRDNRYSGIVVLSLVVLASVAVSGTSSILGTYTMLCHHSYQWWWPAFLTGGAVAVLGYVFAMSIVLSSLGLSCWQAVLAFFLQMTWICAAWFLIMGFIGLAAGFWFNQRLYQAIKLT